jgi:pyruvate/2-oxoglutarate/acetoin dehydrogenase E1 component
MKNKANAPIILDGIKLRKKDRILVIGQPVKKFNGIFRVSYLLDRIQTFKEKPHEPAN